jgi:2'-5' RNA ligase
VPETALIVAVPEAEPFVGDWRAKHDWSGRRGVPAHITVLYPFVPTELVDDRLLAELRELFASQPSFLFDLARVSRFPDVAWLAPEPSEPFSSLTELVAASYPDYPPYEGIHEEVIPHLTVAEGDVVLQDQVEAELAEHLPIDARAQDVVFMFEGDDGLWSEAHRFPLSA